MKIDMERVRFSLSLIQSREKLEELLQINKNGIRDLFHIRRMIKEELARRKVN